MYVAVLEDWILALEGKPQQYGTQFDWGNDGEVSPLPIADPADVDVRRRAVGLGPLVEDIKGGPSGGSKVWRAGSRRPR